MPAGAPVTAAERATRTASADAVCAAAYAAAGGPGHGVAMVAVGGYGRGELAPYSDLDVVLVHDDGVDVEQVASQIWYPLWDSGARLDHSVRSLADMTTAADHDFRVAAGLLDVRHVAGDAHLTLRLRTQMLAQWRRDARLRMSDFRASVQVRHQRVGELAHLSVPDLKEAEGGLRDATALRGLMATWLVDVPSTEVETARHTLLDVRDHVHTLAGRATDRITPEMWPELAHRLDLLDHRAAQRHVREAGRRLTHLSRLTWRRAEAAVARPARRTAGERRRVPLEPLATDVALSGGEVVLFSNADPARDPTLLLRAATAAAERRAVIAPATVARLVRDGAPLPDPWPAEARHLMVRLLASGAGLLDVWETLEETGALARILPEWERIRLVPHASAIHRYTVDRHVVETCIEASALIRAVDRPDVLMVAALLHDIGKGGTQEHCAAGEPIARTVAQRMGFEPDAVDLIGSLVRWHLLLAETATTRDPDDPATVAAITARIPTSQGLSLLAALTEADAKATAPKAWSSWRASLVRGLAHRAQDALDSGVPAASSPADVPVPAGLSAATIAVDVVPLGDGVRVTTVGVDRVGLLADVAATLAVLRIPVRAARVWRQTSGEGLFGVTEWEVDAERVDARVVRSRFEAIAEGRTDVGARFEAGAGDLAPSVAVRPDASTRATVLEVRTEDRSGVIYQVCAALAAHDIAVRSAHLHTFGPQAVDVFYLQEPDAGALSDTRAAAAAHAVREALTRR